MNKNDPFEFTPLMETKLFAPSPRPGHVIRPRLMDKLNANLVGEAGFIRKLTLISAPVGYGKTTLTSQWLQKNDIPFTWLSLEEEDNDPTRFLTYLIATLQKVDPNIGQSAQVMMQAPQPPPSEAFLTTLINDITATDHPFILVLDDYHLIHTLSIHQQIDFLLEHLSPQAHMVIVSREDIPLPLPRLRARGQLVEIRQNDLRFLLEECDDFFQQVMGMDLSPADVAALESRTEGWVAGLQLAAIAMQSPLSGQEQEDLGSFVKSFTGSNRYILDYLIEEVFERQPFEVQDFLLKTSILERLSAPLCDAVAECSNSQDLLQALEEANLFVVPLDQERRWYRYHHLFTELLRHQLRNSTSHSATLLHRQACQWYEKNGFMTQAVKHAFATEDWDVAGRVVEQAAAEAVRNGQIATLHGWIHKLPDDVVQESLNLATITGWVSLLMGQIETALSYAEKAEDLLPVDAPTPDRAALTALRASLALMRQDISNAIELSQETLEQLAEQDDHFLRGMALNNLAQGHMLMGDLSAATATFREMVDLSHDTGHSPASISALANLAGLLHQGGKRREAVLLCQQALDQCVDKRGRLLPLAGYAQIPMGILCYEANDLDIARQHLEQGMKHGEQLGVVTGIVTSAGIAQAQLQRAMGQVEEALATIAEIRQLAAQHNLGYVDFMVAGVEADIQIKQGDIEAAARWAETAGLSSSDMPNPLREGDYFTFARLLLAQDRLDEVDRLLSSFEQFAYEGGRQRSLITVYILQALLCRSRGDTKQVIPCLESALQLAAAEGYRRAFLDEGQALIDLLPTVRHLSPDFVDLLLEDAQAEPGLRIPSPLSQPLIEPLSERELDVLRLVADGLTNREIAERLILSVGTVKTHVHNIYGKLDVRGRTQAIARARELEIL